MSEVQDIHGENVRAVDPEDFLRALLKISPEDAERVREDTPGTRPPPGRHRKKDDHSPDQ